MTTIVCALCQKQKEPKKNTHYLTDAIIRNCLNIDGSAKREQGLYFSLSDDTPYIEYNFQRDTPAHKLEDAINREPTEDEIEKAKQIPFSVDTVFCSSCESIFTSIEVAFIDRYLSAFRQADLTTKQDVILDDTVLVRKFFLLQVWRTAICDDVFRLSEDAKEKLRLIILGETTNNLMSFPLLINYLETLGEEFEYTSNQVGYTSDIEPSFIFMNDFVIQFFENQSKVKFSSLYGLNNDNDFSSFVNLEQELFRVKVVHNAVRKKVLETFRATEKAKQLKLFLNDRFIFSWIQLFGFTPPMAIRYAYFSGLFGNNETDLLRYTEASIKQYTVEFFYRYSRYL